MYWSTWVVQGSTQQKADNWVDWEHCRCSFIAGNFAIKSLNSSKCGFYLRESIVKEDMWKLLKGGEARKEREVTQCRLLKEEYHQLYSSESDSKCWFSLWTCVTCYIIWSSAMLILPCRTCNQLKISCNNLH